MQLQGGCGAATQPCSGVPAPVDTGCTDVLRPSVWVLELLVLCGIAGHHLFCLQQQFSCLAVHPTCSRIIHGLSFAVFLVHPPTDTRSITSSCGICHGALLDNRTGVTAICLCMAEGCSHSLGVCCLLWGGVCGAVCGCVGGDRKLVGAVTGTSLCIVPQVYICSNRCTWQQHPVSAGVTIPSFFLVTAFARGADAKVCCPLASLPGGDVAETACVTEMLGRHLFVLSCISSCSIRGRAAEASIHPDLESVQVPEANTISGSMV